MEVGSKWTRAQPSTFLTALLGAAAVQIRSVGAVLLKQSESSIRPQTQHSAAAVLGGREAARAAETAHNVGIWPSLKPSAGECDCLLTVSCFRRAAELSAGNDTTQWQCVPLSFDRRHAGGRHHQQLPLWASMTTGAANPSAQQPASVLGQVAGCPPHVLAAIYGAKPTAEQKRKVYEASLQRCGATPHDDATTRYKGASNGMNSGSLPADIEGVALVCRWWTEYADRKNDEEDEHVSDSLLYDRSHLPRTIPAPDCVVLTPVPTLAPAPPRPVLVARPAAAAAAAATAVGVLQEVQQVQHQ